MISQKSSRDNAAVSFVKNQFMMMRSRIWVVALAALYAVLEYFVFPIIFLGGRNIVGKIDGEDKAYLIDELRELAEGLFGYDSVMILLGTTVLAIVMGIQGFSYLYNTRSVDFFESQPVSTRKRFFGNYINGVLIFLWVTVVGTILATLIVTLMGIGNLDIYFKMWLEFFRAALLFLGVYSVSVLAAVLSGNVFIAVVVNVFLFGTEFLIRLILYGCCSVYYTTLYEHNEMGVLSSLSSPFGAYFTEGIAGVVNMFAIIVVFTAAAFLAFKKRPREIVGKGLCFSFMESVVKCVIALIAGIGAGMISDQIFDSEFSYNFMFFFLIVFVVVLSCMLSEVILNANVIKAVRRAWQIPIIIVLSIGVMVFFKEDISGYDSFTPKVSKVESAVLVPLRYDNEFIIPVYKDDEGEENVYLEEYLLGKMELADIEAVNALCIEGEKYKREYTIAQSKVNIYDEDVYESIQEIGYTGWDATLMYRMKNGKEIYRSIRIPYDIDETLMNEVIGSEDYKEGFFHLEEMKDRVEDYDFEVDEYVSMEFSNGYDDNAELKIDNENLEQFVAAYEKDLEKYDYSYVQDNDAIGKVFISISNDNYINLREEYTVFEGYENTIALLEEYNLYSKLIVDPTDVEAIATKKYDSEGNISEMNIIRDKDQIETILSKINPLITGVDWKKETEKEYVHIAVAHSGWETEDGYSYDSLEDYFETSLATEYYIRAEKLQ